MVPESVRRAFEETTEDLSSAGAALADLTAAIEADDEIGLLDRYRDLGGDPDARSAVVDMRPFFAAPPGSLGAVLCERFGGVGTIRAGDIWRTVLGCGDDVLSTGRLNAFSAAQNKDLEGTLGVLVLLSRIAFVTPEASRSVGECITSGWLDGKAAAPLAGIDWGAHAGRGLDELRRELALAECPRVPVGADGPVVEYGTAGEGEALALLTTRTSAPAGLWPAFWAAAGAPVDPATITPLVASLGGAFDDRLKDACARDVLSYSGQRGVADDSWWSRLDTDSLRDCRPGTLGYAYYHLIVDNGFDPEVLDPELVSGFHPVLDASNRRILQTHEVWHLLVGFSTSPLHEVAISGFQLAQFGHNYSAMFLATSSTLLGFHLPAFLDPVMQVTWEGWRHGRATAPLMPIDWFALWNEDLDALRRRFEISRFASAIDDFEAAA